MAEGIATTTEMTMRPRKANKCMIDMKHFKPPSVLFGVFWGEGELALMFGAPGVGKSILAMQIADAIARGKGIERFRNTAKRQKVLYVDLKLSDKQFCKRYESFGRKPFKFSENLYRERPPSDKPLGEWLRAAIRANGFRSIVIDDLSAIRHTFDGTRETLKLMRELRLLKDELDVSILVLAGSREPRAGQPVSEKDMMRSRVLCDAADSVFALGRHPTKAYEEYLIQTRNWCSPGVWTMADAARCRMDWQENGFLGFEFDEGFTPAIDDETRKMILDITSRHDGGESYRAIAEDLGISKSTAARLYKKWTPGMEKGLVIEYDDDESEPPASAGGEDLDNAEEAENESDEQLKLQVDTTLEIPECVPPTYSGVTDPLDACGFDPAAIPFAAALKRIPITDLKRGFDGHGREIFIEKEQSDGKPIIWYQYDPKGKLLRNQRGLYSISIERIDGPWILPANAGLGLGDLTSTET